MRNIKLLFGDLVVFHDHSKNIVTTREINKATNDTVAEIAEYFRLSPELFAAAILDKTPVMINARSVIIRLIKAPIFMELIKKRFYEKIIVS